MRFFGKNIDDGFTLIELLVVISIIGILTAIATVSYTNVQMKGRDGKRKADLAAIQQALEVFYADNGAYPDEGYSSPLVATDPTDRVTCEIDGGTILVGISPGSSFACPLSTPTKTYLSKMPADPSTGFGYYYEVKDAVWCKTSNGGSCQKYTLWARLENSNDPDILRNEMTPWADISDPICKTAWSVSELGKAAGYGGNYCVHSPR